MLGQCWVKAANPICGKSKSRERVVSGVEEQGQCWVNAGSMLGQCWVNAGSMEMSLAEYRERLAVHYTSRRKLRSFVPSPDHNIGLVCRIYDGDSFTLLCEIAGKPYKTPVRIAGVDTPEIRGKTPQERRAAKAVRDLLRQMFLGRIASISAKGVDKYGRLLAAVEIEGNDLATYLLSRNLAYPYEGSRKRPFTQADLQSIQARLGYS